MAAAYDDVVELLIAPGGGRGASSIHFSAGTIVERRGSAVLPIRAEAAHAHLFVRLDANLEAGDLSAGRTQLSLQGTYEPGSELPWDVPAPRCHRLTEAVVKGFVERIATRIGGDDPAQPLPSRSAGR
jgi:hypothetical protein